MSEPSQSTGHEADSPPSARPGARERSRMRRRLREQRRVREALLLDLGALVFELHRHGRREPELLQAKASELSQVDAEVRGLSEALETDLGVVELVAAGIAGSCENCGALLSVDTRFCPSCGAAAKPGLEAKRAPAPQLAVEQPTVAEPPLEPEEWDEEPMPTAGAEELEPVFEEEAYVLEEDEPGEFGEEPEPAEEVAPAPEEPEEVALEPEPAEPEPAEPEPAEPEPVAAPWLQEDQDPAPAAEAPPETEPQPPPQKVKRPMSRLERTLRGKRRDGS